MYPVRIIATKIGKSYKLAQYINQLSKQAANHPGFIASNSYWINNNGDKNNINKIISISDWIANDSWKNWYNSTERKNIKDKHNDILYSEDFQTLVKRRKRNDIFLL